MKEHTLFDDNILEPLASRMRPKTLEEFVGQEHLLGEGKILSRLIDNDQIPSMIFYGPPGVGKTTLASIIAEKTKAHFIVFSAVKSGIKEIKSVMEEAESNQIFGMKTIVFVDEIHRFNKAQQDAFLPYVEKGSIILIGATTENPSFEVNSALLSRAKVFMLKQLDKNNIIDLLKRAILTDSVLSKMKIKVEDDILEVIATYANGDARLALSTLEMCALNGEEIDGKTIITAELIGDCLSKKSLMYDKKGEEHYNIISALHKSMRNSDPDAAIYWLARMLEGGEDPLYIARRVTRFASEDIGLADTNALNVAINAYQACHFIGYPECSVHLTEAVVYMSLAPKSNAMYVGYETAKKDALTDLAKPVPLNICNAPTKMMKELDYGKGYIYAHDTKDKLTTMDCLPDNLLDRTYYMPTEEGNEIRFKQRLESIKIWKKQHKEMEKKYHTK